VALDKGSGKEIWRALNDAFTYSSPIVVTAGGRRQLIVWTQPAVTSLDAATGQIWWREMFQTPGDTAVSTPVFANDRLLIGGLMFQLNTEKPAASVLWPDTRAVSKRVATHRPLLCKAATFTRRELPANLSAWKPAAGNKSGRRIR